MAGQPSKTCASCGRVIEWRRKWERNWDDVRYCSDACRRRKVTPVDAALEQALVDALAGPGATVDPDAVARERGGAEDWQQLREPARRAARRLCATGRYELLAAGRVVDPSTAKGDVRLRRR